MNNETNNTTVMDSLPQTVSTGVPVSTEKRHRGRPRIHARKPKFKLCGIQSKAFDIIPEGKTLKEIRSIVEDSLGLRSERVVGIVDGIINRKFLKKNPKGRYVMSQPDLK